MRDMQNDPEKLPMFRILSAKNSLTFTAPDSGFAMKYEVFIPEALMLPFANLGTQLSGDGDFATRYANAATGFFLGDLAGVHVQDHGSSLVSETSGQAKNTIMLNDPRVDVKREYFNAASNITDSLSGNIAEMALSIAQGIIDVDDLLSFAPGVVRDAVKISLSFAGATSFTAYMPSAIYAGINDLIESHQFPLYRQYQSEWKGDKNTYSLIEGGSKTVEPYFCSVPA